MLEQTVWKATTSSGETCHFGHEGIARAWAKERGSVEKLVIRMPYEVPMGAVERELATARGLCSSVCDDDSLNEADAEVFKLRKVEQAAELACGLLWMVEDRSGKVRAAFHALRDALGGAGSKGLGQAIKRAIDAGHEADHPPGADWWAGKKHDRAIAELKAIGPMRDRLADGGRY